MMKYTHAGDRSILHQAKICKTTLGIRRSQKLGEVPNICGKENVTSILKKHKDLQSHRLVRLISIPGKVMIQLILGVISRNMNYKAVIRSQ